MRVPSLAHGDVCQPGDSLFVREPSAHLANTRTRPQERVWKKEREALEERKKLQQLQKELEQERAVQELQRLQEAAGGKKRDERVDWMYAAPAEGNGPNPDELEAYLLGKKRVDKLLKGNEEKVRSRDSLRAFRCSACVDLSLACSPCAAPRPAHGGGPRRLVPVPPERQHLAGHGVQDPRGPDARHQAAGATPVREDDEGPAQEARVARGEGGVAWRWQVCQARGGGRGRVEGGKEGEEGGAQGGKGGEVCVRQAAPRR